jgi:hypothetical protein
MNNFSLTPSISTKWISYEVIKVKNFSHIFDLDSWSFRQNGDYSLEYNDIVERLRNELNTYPQYKSECAVDYRNIDIAKAQENILDSIVSQKIHQSVSLYESEDRIYNYHEFENRRGRIHALICKYTPFRKVDWCSTLVFLLKCEIGIQLEREEFGLHNIYSSILTDIYEEERRNKFILFSYSKRSVSSDRSITDSIRDWLYDIYVIWHNYYYKTPLVNLEQTIINRLFDICTKENEQNHNVHIRRLYALERELLNDRPFDQYYNLPRKFQKSPYHTGFFKSEAGVIQGVIIVSTLFILTRIDRLFSMLDWIITIIIGKYVNWSLYYEIYILEKIDSLAVTNSEDHTLAQLYFHSLNRIEEEDNSGEYVLFYSSNSVSRDILYIVYARLYNVWFFPPLVNRERTLAKIMFETVFSGRIKPTMDTINYLAEFGNQKDIYYNTLLPYENFRLFKLSFSIVIAIEKLLKASLEPGMYFSEGLTQSQLSNRADSYISQLDMFGKYKFKIEEVIGKVRKLDRLSINELETFDILREECVKSISEIPFEVDFNLPPKDKLRKRWIETEVSLLDIATIEEVEKIYPKIVYNISLLESNYIIPDISQYICKIIAFKIQNLKEISDISVYDSEVDFIISYIDKYKLNLLYPSKDDCRYRYIVDGISKLAKISDITEYEKLWEELAVIRDSLADKQLVTLPKRDKLRIDAIKVTVEKLQTDLGMCPNSYDELFHKSTILIDGLNDKHVSIPIPLSRKDVFILNNFRLTLDQLNILYKLCKLNTYFKGFVLLPDLFIGIPIETNGEKLILFSSRFKEGSVPTVDNTLNESHPSFLPIGEVSLLYLKAKASKLSRLSYGHISSKLKSILDDHDITYRLGRVPSIAEQQAQELLISMEGKPDGREITIVSDIYEVSFDLIFIKQRTLLFVEAKYQQPTKAKQQAEHRKKMLKMLLKNKGIVYQCAYYCFKDKSYTLV